MLGPLIFKFSFENVQVFYEPWSNKLNRPSRKFEYFVQTTVTNTQSKVDKRVK